ncbi:MAG TPA: acyl-CoA dehydrogenase family protein [Dehalococcoidia bacterium]|nr:acyl-CoA dehydrogenase family protein [Dehalococcoidia bacterium]
MVDFNDNEEQATFRTEVRDFIATNLPDQLRLKPDEDRRFDEDDPDEKKAAIAKWREALVDKGWIAPMWPEELGGAQMTKMEQFIVNEEFTEASAPRLSVPTVGSTIMVHGSEEQKKEFLPKMVTGETRWCQGYSEPGSGSDLASLQTRAIRDGDDFVINGQKIWTSGAHLSNMMFALVRTDPEAPKHRGITYILLPMDSPGITVRPLKQMSEASGFNEVFFEDVRVPVRNAIGEVNRGWYVGATHLDFERSGIGQSLGQRQTLDALRDFLIEERDTDTGRSMIGRSQPVRAALAERYVEAEVAKNFSYRVISMEATGQIPNHEASVAKMFNTELSQRLARTATQTLGLYGGLFDEDDEWTPMKRRWSRMYLSTVSATLAGGTSEIQRNVIATRGLGLPRG